MTAKEAVEVFNDFSVSVFFFFSVKWKQRDDESEWANQMKRRRAEGMDRSSRANQAGEEKRHSGKKR